MLNTIIIAVVLIVGTLVAAFLIGGRYSAVGSGSSVYVVDRLTGTVRECSSDDCRKLLDVADALPSARQRKK